MPRQFSCPECAKTITTYMRDGESTPCQGCGKEFVVPGSEREPDEQPATPSRTGPKGCLIALALLLVPCLCTYRPWNHFLLKPPASVQTLEDFLAWRPQTTRFSRITRDGRHRVEAQGPAAYAFSSGPSVYVFDEEARLFDWTYDCGDDPQYRERCRGWRGQRITREDALHIVGLASGIRDLSVVLKGPPEATEALRRALEPDGLVTLPRSGQVYRLRVMELDTTVVFRYVVLETVPDGGYEVRILSPWKSRDELELSEEMAQAIEDLLRKP